MWGLFGGWGSGFRGEGLEFRDRGSIRYSLGWGFRIKSGVASGIVWVSWMSRSQGL